MKPLSPYRMVGATYKLPQVGDRNKAIFTSIGIDIFEAEIPNSFRAVSWEVKVLIQCTLEGGLWF